MKTDPYSALDKPQKHTLRGRTSGRSFTLSASPPGDLGSVKECEAIMVLPYIVKYVLLCILIP